MNFNQQDEKNISKVFSFLRAQLQAKEKELLQQQRKDPSLSSPDSQQIEMLVDAIASLQLSTQDESFVFASLSDDQDENYTSSSPPYASVCSDDFNAIKALPLTTWLPEERLKQQANQRQSSMFHHLLSLPIRAYLSSSWPAIFDSTTKTKSSQSFYHLSMKSHLLFMPLNSFKPSSNGYINNTIKENNMPQKTQKDRSFLNDDVSFSKEFWLDKNRHGSNNYQIISCV